MTVLVGAVGVVLIAAVIALWIFLEDSDFLPSFGSSSGNASSSNIAPAVVAAFTESDVEDFAGVSVDGIDFIRRHRARAKALDPNGPRCPSCRQLIDMDAPAAPAGVRC